MTNTNKNSNATLFAGYNDYVGDFYSENGESVLENLGQATSSAQGSVH